MSGRSG